MASTVLPNNRLGIKSPAAKNVLTFCAKLSFIQCGLQGAIEKC